MNRMISLLVIVNEPYAVDLAKISEGVDNLLILPVLIVAYLQVW